jgi:hypothetical protein
MTCRKIGGIVGRASTCSPTVFPAARRARFKLARTDSTLVSNLRKLATSIVDCPPDAATFIAHVITGGPVGVPAPAVSRIVRRKLNEIAATGWIPAA